MKSVKLYTDGGIRSGIIAFGYIAYSSSGDEEVVFGGSDICGIGTSNDAEYMGLIKGLEAALYKKVKRIHVFMDSKLVVQQVNGDWRAKQKSMADKRDRALKLLEKFNQWSLTWVPREYNKVADSLARKAFKDHGK